MTYLPMLNHVIALAGIYYMVRTIFFDFPEEAKIKRAVQRIVAVD